MKLRLIKVVAVAAATCCPSLMFAQEFRTASFPADYRAQLNIPYMKDGAWEGRLDVYGRTSTAATPVVIWWHGANGSKEQQFMLVLPLLEMGFSVVLPQAQDSPTSRSQPSVTQITNRAVAGRCALRWVTAHSTEYKFDQAKVVLAGSSLGGYTALMAGFVTKDAGFDGPCPGDSEPRVAAILNFFGPIRLPEERVRPGSVATPLLCAH